MNYGSVCSGIEAASIAWEPEWQPAWFSEIEDAPSKVLAHHWPHVQNHGDMTKLHELVYRQQIVAPDVLVGGTPCQAFSVAGTRSSLSDDRGALSLAFIELANAIDTVRSHHGQPECIITWENVPGVLSTTDNAFGCFLAGLAGDDVPCLPGPRPADGKTSRYWGKSKKTGEHFPKWAKSGCVYGPRRAVAWRVLDAQYFGVAQRRKRVFVVASARDGFDPAAVLFERQGVRRDTPPSRETQEAAALTAVVRTANTNSNGQGVSLNGPVYTLDSEAGGQALACWWDGGQISQTLDAVLQKGQAMPEKNRFPAVLQQVTAVHGTQDAIVSDNLAHPLGRNNGQENAIFSQLAVRKLMPVECERLQGFPDSHTDIGLADGPRYKCIGNSMAVPCMRFLKKQIEAEIARSTR